MVRKTIVYRASLFPYIDIMPIKAVIYARVSTTGQSPENQVAELQAVADRMGWHVSAIYVDHGISGSKGYQENSQRA